MTISLLMKTVQPDQSNLKMHEGYGFSAKTLWKKLISFANYGVVWYGTCGWMVWCGMVWYMWVNGMVWYGMAMVRLASSDKWKVPLNSFKDFSVHAYFLNKEMTGWSKHCNRHLKLTPYSDTPTYLAGLHQKKLWLSIHDFLLAQGPLLFPLAQ